MLLAEIPSTVTMAIRYQDDEEYRVVDPYIAYGSYPHDITITCHQHLNPKKPSEVGYRDFKFSKIMNVIFGEARFEVRADFNPSNSKYRGKIIRACEAEWLHAKNGEGETGMHGQPVDLRVSRLLKAQDYLERVVWWNNIDLRRQDIEMGHCKVVTEDEFKAAAAKQRGQMIIDAEWQAELEEAKAIEADIGIENLETESFNDLAVIEAKLEAIRWALGNECDDLEI